MDDASPPILWDAPPECAAFTTAAVGAIGERATTGTAARAQVKRRAEGGFSLLLVIPGGSGQNARELHGPSCDELVSAAREIVALAAERAPVVTDEVDAASEDKSAESPEAANTAELEFALPRRLRELPPDEPRPLIPRAGTAVAGVRGAMGVGDLSSPTGGFGVQIAWLNRNVRAGLEGYYFPKTTVTVLGASPTRADRTVLAAVACRKIVGTTTKTELAGCGALEGGRIVADGPSVLSRSTNSALWLAPRASGLLTFGLGGPVRATLELAVLVPIAHSHFDNQALDTALSPFPVTGRFSGGVEAILP